MQRIRNRTKKGYRAAHRQFGTAGLVLSIIALVFAMFGGAYAATHHKRGKSNARLTPKQKKEVKKLAEQYAGKPGLPGANGKDGAQGSKGDPGAAGASVLISNSAPGCQEGGVTLEVEGAPASSTEVCDGTDGEDGIDGEDGSSAEVSPIAVGDNQYCEGRGGVLVFVEGGAEEPVCNGEPGPEGALGTAGTTLPPGATETGVWAFYGNGQQTITTEVGGVTNTYTVGNKEMYAPISFPIPLGGQLAATQVHYQTDAGFSSVCAGTAVVPDVPPGHLCVYQGNQTEGPTPNATFKEIARTGNGELGAGGTNRTGAVVLFELTGAKAHGSGVFAVTAPDPIVTGISPDHGPAAGGTSITITGTNLSPISGATAVKIGGVNATGCTADATGTSVTCTTPAHAAGPAEVVVTVAGYASPEGEASTYTYE